MLGVQDIYALRHKALVEGKSQRQVAREMGLARDTVRRYLATPLPEPRKRKRSRPVLEQLSRGVVGAHHGPEAAAGAARGSSSTTSWRQTTFCASPERRWNAPGSRWPLRVSHARLLEMEGPLEPAWLAIDGALMLVQRGGTIDRGALPQDRGGSLAGSRLSLTCPAERHATRRT